MKPHRYVLGQAEYLGASRFRWAWPCGHTKTEVFKIGPRGAKRPISESAARLMAWTWKGYGGVNLPLCRVCLRRARA